ncbi:hypothetical protein SCO70_02345 [Legionella pneumophila serogroup 3]
MKINIRGVDKADVLAALYNGAHGGIAGGFSYLQGEMTQQQAKLLVEKQTNLYFDYVDNRPLKIDLSGDIIDTTLYDHYNGGCAAQRALSHLPLPSDQPVEEIKKQDPGKVCEHIFRTYIQPVDGYPADAYGDNLRALQYAHKACGVDRYFFRDFLNREYTEQGGGLFGLGLISRYTQRRIILKSDPSAGLEILYACFSFIRDKEDSLLNELLSAENPDGPNSQKIARALVGDLEYLRDSRLRWLSRGRQPALIDDFLKDRRKASIVLTAILRGESAPEALKLIMDHITSGNTALDNIVVYNSLKVLQEKISVIPNECIRLELFNILDESIQKHSYSNVLFAMEQSIKKVNSSWNYNNIKEKSEALARLRLNFLNDPSQENYKAFISEAAKPRKSWIFQAQEGKTSSLIAFNNALSEKTKQIYEGNRDYTFSTGMST